MSTRQHRSSQRSITVGDGFQFGIGFLLAQAVFFAVFAICWVAFLGGMMAVARG